MLKPYLKAIQTRLLAKTQTAMVDLWNSQTTNTGDTIVSPSVFVDFGKVQWSTLSSDIKQGYATIHIHCVCADYMNALDALPNVLNRFTFSASVLAALENYVAKDEEGLLLFKGLELASTQMGTDADTLKDDIISFNALLYYYDVWREKNWQQIILQGVETEYDGNIAAGANGYHPGAGDDAAGLPI